MYDVDKILANKTQKSGVIWSLMSLLTR